MQVASMCGSYYTMYNLTVITYSHTSLQLHNYILMQCKKSGCRSQSVHERTMSSVLKKIFKKIGLSFHERGGGSRDRDRQRLRVFNITQLCMSW